jgi:hypothetical protein
MWENKIALTQAKVILEEATDWIVAKLQIF